MSVEPLGAEALTASDRIHRYRLAASLCEGLRVADLGDAEANPAEFLKRELAEDYDALVCVEGLERVEDPAAVLAALGRHAKAGIRLVVSLPREQWTYEEAMEALEPLGEVTVLYQFPAEGSLIRGTEPSGLSPEFVLPGHGEVEWASHFIACANFDERLRELGDSAQMQLLVAPEHTRRIEALEQANQELWRENARIGRERIGMGGSAAAMAADRLREATEHVRELEQRVSDLEQVLATPRHAWVDRLRDRLRKNAQVDRALRSFGAWLGRN